MGKFELREREIGKFLELVKIHTYYMVIALRFSLLICYERGEGKKIMVELIHKTKVRFSNPPWSPKLMRDVPVRR